MLKTLIIAATLVGTCSSYAQCPSVDSKIQQVKRGEAIPLDVLEVVACQIPTCENKLAFLKSKLFHRAEQFAVGEVSKIEVADAALEYAGQVNQCSAK